MILLSVLFACGELEPKSEDSGAEMDTAVNEVDPNSIDQYKAVYCEEYSMRCNVYESVEACEAEFDTWFAADCTISDKEAFDVCADWLFSLDCSVEGWIDECDQFYTCP